MEQNIIKKLHDIENNRDTNINVYFEYILNDYLNEEKEKF
jgi:hypothetical protein